jgi:hypothetical protein
LLSRLEMHDALCGFLTHVRTQHRIYSIESPKVGAAEETALAALGRAIPQVQKLAPIQSIRKGEFSLLAISADGRDAAMLAGREIHIVSLPDFRPRSAILIRDWFNDLEVEPAAGGWLIRGLEDKWGYWSGDKASPIHWWKPSSAYHVRGWDLARGRIFMVRGDSLRAIAVQTGKLLFEVKLPFAGDIHQILDVSPDGATAWVGGFEKTDRVWCEVDLVGQRIKTQVSKVAPPTWRQEHRQAMALSGTYVENPEGTIAVRKGEVLRAPDWRPVAVLDAGTAGVERVSVHWPSGTVVGINYKQLLVWKLPEEWVK